MAVTRLVDSMVMHITIWVEFEAGPHSAARDVSSWISNPPVGGFGLKFPDAGKNPSSSRVPQPPSGTQETQAGQDVACDLPRVWVSVRVSGPREHFLCESDRLAVASEAWQLVDEPIRNPVSTFGKTAPCGKLWKFVQSTRFLTS